MRWIIAVGAIALSGCKGSWLYPVGWPDRTGLRLQGTTQHLTVWAEPNRIDRGVWEPLMEAADLQTVEVLELLDIDDVERVDVYVHGECFDPVGHKDCVRLKAQTASPYLIDLWFGKVFHDRVDVQVTTMRHEFAHAATGQAYGGCPRYLLEEGLAEYARLSGSEPVAPLDVPGTTMDDLAEALGGRNGAWIPLDEIVNTGEFVRLLEEGTDGLLYAEAGALAEHLINFKDLDAFLELQDRTCASNEATFHEAFEEIYGTDLRAIDRALSNAAGAWQ